MPKRNSVTGPTFIQMLAKAAADPSSPGSLYKHHFKKMYQPTGVAPVSKDVWSPLRFSWSPKISGPPQRSAPKPNTGPWSGSYSGPNGGGGYSIDSKTPQLSQQYIEGLDREGPLAPLIPKMLSEYNTRNPQGQLQWGQRPGLQSPFSGSLLRGEVPKVRSPFGMQPGLVPVPN